jgi:hypothetical protein
MMADYQLTQTDDIGPPHRRSGMRSRTTPPTATGSNIKTGSRSAIHPIRMCRRPSRWRHRRTPEVTDLLSYDHESRIRVLEGLPPLSLENFLRKWKG